MPGYRRAYKTARRLYPLLLSAYHRWDNLSDAEKERYKKQARQIVNQAAGYARDAASRSPVRKRGGPGSGRKKPRR
jgi:hypothetical protein